MADGDVERFNLVSRTHHRTYRLSLVNQRHPTPLLLRNLTMAAGEAGFGDTDGGRIRIDPKMAGDAEASRMGHALSVTEKDIG